MILSCRAWPEQFSPRCRKLRAGASIDSLFLAEGNDCQPTEWGVGPWSADTLQGSAVGDRGIGVARGTLSDLDGPFGACAQTLLFEQRPSSR